MKASGSEPSFAALGSIPAEPSARSREQVLREYREYLQAERQRKKQQHKRVVVESARKRPPRLLLKQDAGLRDGRRQHHEDRGTRSAQVLKKQQVPPAGVAGASAGEKPSEDAGPQKLNDYLKKVARQFVRKESVRPEGWAAAKVNHAMVKYHIMQILAAKRKPKHLYAQSKKLFEECCKCKPSVQGPVMSEDGILRLGGPNLPKILRILQSKENEGLDLLQPHGLDQCTVAHVAAQRGYTELARELLAHWIVHPMESPFQAYSFTLLRRLLDVVLQLRKVKALVSESNSDLRDLIAEIGVPFAHFSDELDKLNDEAITLTDLLRICGHPLALSKDASGNTPLHYAAEAGYLPLCELFVINGAKINAQNKSGETPLHFAISSRRPEVCQYLVQRHADVRICRYVQLTLINGVTLRGTFEDSPDGNAVCRLMPALHSRSAGAHPGDAAIGRRQVLNSILGDKAAALMQLPKLKHAPVSPEENNTSRISERDNLSSDAMANYIDGGAFRVDSLFSSPLFCGRNPRDVIFFRAAPGSSLLKPNLLCVLLLGDHVTPVEVFKAREQHQKGKIFHLLIHNYPNVAVLAMDSFRVPMFRCNMKKDVREYNQQWVIDHKVKNPREKHAALLLQMRGDPTKHKRKRRRRRKLLLHIIVTIWKSIKRLWRFIRRVRNALSVQNVFAPTEAHSGHRESIVCEPKGILYEYIYDHAEFRGGVSPTLSWVLETECKELMFHPWVSKLMDHKWNSFARQTFRSDFHIYFAYFVAVFVATYLYVGDTYVGMPVGGYRNHAFTDSASWHVYVRDIARIVYTVINAYYSYREYKSFMDCVNIRNYLRDGWTGFNLVQILCVWILLITELVETLIPNAMGSDNDFRLLVYQESMYNIQMWRVYNFRLTLMSIVGPQVFIRWIQFARGTQLLGPFVRMIAKMFTDVLVFVLVYCVFLCGFAFAFFILQIEGCRSYMSSITSVFQISIGSWDWDSIYEGGPVAILHFIAYAVIGTIMLLNLLIAMLGNTYDKIWEDRLLFFELERAKATLTIQSSIDDDIYDEKYWCQRLYALEDDTPIEGLPFQKF